MQLEWYQLEVCRNYISDWFVAHARGKSSYVRTWELGRRYKRSCLRDFDGLGTVFGVQCDLIFGRDINQIQLQMLGTI